MAGDDRDWHVPVHPSFARSGLSARARDVMDALCCRARDKLYTWMSNDELGELTGLHPDSIKRGLGELERAGWIVRPMGEGRWTRRVGVILLDRPDRRFWPVAEDGPGYTSTIEALRRERLAWQAHRRRLQIRRAGVTGVPAK